MTTVRRGQAPPPLSREQFGERFRSSYYDPAFGAERDAIARLEVIAWKAYDEGRKARRNAQAGRGFADPEYALS
jgi:hypothetical protein